MRVRLMHAAGNPGAGFRLAETLAKLPPSSFLPPPFFKFAANAANFTGY
jgi:hypothetical protein